MDGPGFIIGVEQQPIHLLEQWVALGVNTFVRPGQGQDVAAWIAECNRLNAWQIRDPYGDPAADAATPLLLAWTFPDEPDLKGVSADTLHKMRGATDGLTLPRKIPWMVTFAGGLVLDVVKPPTGIPSPDYSALAAQAEWIASDIYPVTGWNLTPGVDLFAPMRCVSKLRKVAPGKPQLAYLECSNQKPAWLPQSRCVSKDEFAVQTMGLSQAKVDGIVLFPFVDPANATGQFAWDGTPSEIQCEIPKLVRRF